MKKYLVFSLAIAALMAASCQIEIYDPIVDIPAVETVEFNVVAGDIETKTAAVDGAIPSIKWLSTDQIKVYEVITDSESHESVFTSADSGTPTLSNSDKTASFKVTLTGTPSEATGYKYTAVYPKSAVSKPSSYYRLVIPKNQELVGNNFSHDSDVLFSEVYDNGANRVTADQDVSFRFKRLGTVVKLTLNGISDGERVQSIVLTAPVNIAGAVKFDPITGTIDSESWHYDNTTTSKTVTLSVDNVEADGSDVFWFRVLCKEDWEEGQSFSISVETDLANYIKDITLPAGKCIKFHDGGLTSFGIDLSAVRDEKPIEKTYTRATNASSVYVGSKIIIADFGENNYAISTTQNSNNRAGTSITKSNEGASITTNSIYVQELTVVEGTVPGSFGFYTGEGYLYAASSNSNHMKTEAELSDNSSWTIEIAATGEATLLAQGSNTRNKMRFNPNNGNPIFSCYASDSSTGTAVSIYFHEDLRAESEIAWDDTDGLGDVKDQQMVLPNLVNPHGLTVTYSSSDPTVATVLPNAHTVTLLKEGTTQIHAIFAGNQTYKNADVYYTLTVDDSRDAGDTPVLQYTLTPTGGSNNNYASNCDITVDDGNFEITWNLTGNSTTDPWRIGGKSLEGVDRELYSKTALPASITSIVIDHGNGNSITVNSMTVIVSKNSDFSNPVSTLTPEYANNSEVTVNRPDGKDWSNCFYKIVYNVTVSVSSNKFIEFKSAKFYGLSLSSPTPQATATVTTEDASNIAQTTAVLNATYSGATGNVDYTGFEWGTSEGNLTHDEIGSSTSSPFTATISGLTENTTYYYRAYVGEYNESTSNYEYRYGSVRSFTTLAAVVVASPGYLGCYEMPEVSLQSNSIATGNETFGSATWVRHQTSTASQRIVTHRFLYDGSTGDSAKECDSGSLMRNYTALVDQNKRCALWTAYPMHGTAYKNNDTGRVGSFSTSTSYDPAIPNSWQSSGATSDYNTGGNYSRGHHCASEDRQTTNFANKQTFYYTNQSPQKQTGFNGSIWGSLETRVQSVAASTTGRDTLYVVVGVLFEGNNTHDSNDGGDVGLPSHFYKLLMKCSFNAGGTMTAAQGIAFMYTNQAHSGNYYGTDTETGEDFVYSINDIEERTGFNFFANVPSALQEAAESNTSHSWFTGK